MVGKRSVRSRLVLAVLLVTVALFAVSTGVLVKRFINLGRDAAERLISARVAATAQRIGEPLRQRVECVEFLARSLNGLSAENAGRDIASFSIYAAKIAASQPAGSTLWASFDYRYFHFNVDGINENAYRTLRFYNNGVRVMRFDSLIVEGDGLYERFRDKGMTQVTSPSRAEVSQGEFQLFQTFVAPVFDSSGRGMGVVGIDFSLLQCYQDAQKALPLSGAYSMVVAGDLSLVSYPNKSNIGLPFEDVLTTMPGIKTAMDGMQRGDTVRMLYRNIESGQETMFFSVPIRLVQNEPPWAYCEVVPFSSVLAEAKVSWRSIVSVVIIALALLIVALVVIANRFARPLARASSSLRQLSQGRLDESLRLNVSREDEIGEIARSTNRLLEGLRDKALFAEAIGQGKLNASYAADEEDILGQSLKAMQMSLRVANEREEAQRRVENQQAWATKGIAEFAELFRKNTDSIDTFSYQMVHALVEYIGANVGAVFLLEKEQSTQVKSFRMAASYAYEIRRFKEQRIAWGEGLVGRCGIERQRILLTDIPTGYVKIASGLGECPPTALLLVPMVVREELVGVLEVASLSVFEEYVIQFVESVVGAFAGTLLTVEGNQRTQVLLREAQEQSKTLREQEDTMRQNYEELQAIQEESEQQKAVMESLEHAVQVACFVAEFDRDARMVRVNDDFLSTIRASREEMIGTHAAEFLSLHQEIARDFSHFWEEILEGVVKRQMFVEMTYRNQHFFFIETYAPIYNAGGEVTGVIRIGYPAQGSDREERDGQ